MMERPVEFKPVKTWRKISDDAQDFVQRALARNPDDRFSAEEALRHRWLDEQFRVVRESVMLVDAVESIREKRGIKAKFARLFGKKDSDKAKATPAQRPSQRPGAGRAQPPPKQPNQPQPTQPGNQSQPANLSARPKSFRPQTLRFQPSDLASIQTPQPAPQPAPRPAFEKLEPVQLLEELQMQFDLTIEDEGLFVEDELEPGMAQGLCYACGAVLQFPDSGGHIECYECSQVNFFPPADEEPAEEDPFAE